MNEFLKAASPATENFESLNAEIISHGKDLEQSDIKSKVAECKDKLKEMNDVLLNYSI